MHMYKLNKDLLPYMPKGSYESFDEESEVAVSNQSGVKFNRAVEFARCLKQQSESPHPDLYVLSGDQICNDAYLSKFLRQHRVDHFMVLRGQVNMLDKMIIANYSESDPLHLHDSNAPVTMDDTRKLHRISMLSEPYIVETAYKNRIETETNFAKGLDLQEDDRYCFVLFFDHPIAVGFQKTDFGIQKMNDALCVILQESNGIKVRNMFTFCTNFNLKFK